MAYAQKNYSQKQGVINQRLGNYSIATIGCFLTSFCNLEADYGVDIAPDGLDNYFRDHGLYTDIDDGIVDDVGWGSVGGFDVRTQVVQTVDHGTERSSGWPNSNQAIVRFYYKSIQSGKMIFHFCKVADFRQQLILDSWDGQVKKSPYGEPTAWAIYEHKAPVSTSSPTVPVIAPLADPDFVPKQVRIIKSPTASKWGVNWAFDYRAAHPLAERPAGDIFTAVGLIVCPDGNSYYRDDPASPDGYNVKDCEDYTPPKAPSSIGSFIPADMKLAEKVKLLDALPYYGSYDDVIRENNPLGSFPVREDDYFVHDKKGSMWVVAGDNMAYGFWVNISKNVAPPPSAVPEKITEVIKDAAGLAAVIGAPVPTTPQPSPIPTNWRVTRSADLTGRGKVVWYRATNEDPLIIKDLEGRQPDIIMQPYNRDDFGNEKAVPVLQFFDKDGQEYARTQKVAREFWFYGIPSQYLDKVTQEVPFDYNHNGRHDLDDATTAMQGFIETVPRWLNSGKKVIHDLSKTDKIVHAKARAGQLIDGFTRKKGNK